MTVRFHLAPAGPLSNRWDIQGLPYSSAPSPRHPKARQRRWETTPSSRSSARPALVWLMPCHAKLQCHQQRGRHPAWQPRRLVRFDRPEACFHGEFKHQQTMFRRAIV